MGLDPQGHFWFFDPWVAASTIVVAVGLLLWCHLSLGAGDSERAVAVPARARRMPSAQRRTAASGAGASHRVAVERGRRDANRRRVA